MKISIVFLLLLTFYSCKSQNQANEEVNKFLEVRKLQNIVKNVNCFKDGAIIVNIDNQKNLLIQSKICDVFEDFLQNEEIVHLNITGTIDDKSFKKSDGDYRVFGMDSLGNLKQIEFSRLTFGNYGFTEDYSKLKESVLYKVSMIDFKIKHKINDTGNEESKRYKLTLVFTPAPYNSDEDKTNRDEE